LTPKVVFLACALLALLTQVRPPAHIPSIAGLPPEQRSRRDVNADNARCALLRGTGSVAVTDNGLCRRVWDSPQQLCPECRTCHSPDLHSLYGGGTRCISGEEEDRQLERSCRSRVEQPWPSLRRWVPQSSTLKPKS